MKKIFAGLIAILAMVFGQPVAAEESPFYGRLDLQYQVSKNTDEQSSLFGKIAYGEYSVTEKVSVTTSAYHDAEYWEMVPGFAYQVSDETQLGIGVGRARYDGQNWTVYNSWLYYENGNIEALLLANYIPKDKKDPLFLKGYVKWHFAKKHYASIHGESYLGVGPRLGTKLAENVDFWVMLPVFDKQEMRAMAGISMVF
jgi:hypothetical protein